MSKIFGRVYETLKFEISFFWFCDALVVAPNKWKLSPVLNKHCMHTVYIISGIIMQVDVNGKNAAPLYKYLKSQKGGLIVDGIKWNFTKFLVNKEGKVIERYAPTTSPLKIEVWPLISSMISESILYCIKDDFTYDSLLKMCPVLEVL